MCSVQWLKRTGFPVVDGGSAAGEGGLEGEGGEAAVGEGPVPGQGGQNICTPGEGCQCSSFFLLKSDIS